MSRNLALFFDGTWNKPQQLHSHNTNVYLMYQATQLSDSFKWYDQGVGSRWHDRFRGGLFGVGLSKNIQQAYKFLCYRYRPGDRIFLFGFSRGAYTARSLAGLIRKCGLLNPDLVDIYHEKPHEDIISQAYEFYRRRDPVPDAPDVLEFRLKYSRKAEIEFVGVFDTVGSLGVPSSLLRVAKEWGFEHLSGLFEDFRERYRFHDTRLSRIINRAYHAVAIDEFREDFNVSLWDQKTRPDQVLEQVWFAGAHSDIGGGYSDRGLANLALGWMSEKAREAGLPVGTVGSTNPTGAELLHDSYQGEFKLVPPFVRQVQGTLHPSVAVRWNSSPRYKPTNLKGWLEQATG